MAFEKEYLMKIALINENSQAAKNEMICATLKKVVEPMGHEVFNYCMCGAEDPNSDRKSTRLNSSHRL